MANQSKVQLSLDDLFQTLPVGSTERAIGNNLYGINHRQMPGMVPMNKDQYGLTFFVRPQLNLQSDNIRNERLFYPLLANNSLSIQRYIRCTLDPRIMYGYPARQTMVGRIDCPILDPLQAFIPVLTNNLNSISGWPDIVAPTFSSNAGVYQEVYSQVDGITKNYEAYDIDASFRNTKGDPIVYLFYIWVHYQSLVFEGRMLPYPDFIVENEIDYNTRIYRLVLDEQRKYVRKIAATGAAFPLSVPTASFFDFNNERPFNDQNKDITIRFRCMGVIYQDDILVREFNQAVIIFNPDMKAVAESGSTGSSDGKPVTAGSMIRVSRDLLTYFNNRGYPWINHDTYELEWWVPANLFNKRAQAFLNQNTTDPYTQDQQFQGD